LDLSLRTSIFFRRLDWCGADNVYDGTQFHKSHRISTPNDLNDPRAYNERLTKVPHPIPYQGSKRNLASQILAYFPKHIDTLIEPFAVRGQSRWRRHRGARERFRQNDLNGPLMELWRVIVEEPHKLAKQYEIVWRAQHETGGLLRQNS